MSNVVFLWRPLALLWLLGLTLAASAAGGNGPQTLPPTRAANVAAAAPALPAAHTGARVPSADELIPSATTAGRAHPLALEPVGSLYGIAWTFAISGTMAYVAMGDVLNIIDVSTPALPVRRSSLPIPVSAIQVVGHLAYAIETPISGASSRLQIADVSDPNQPTLLGSYGPLGRGFDVQVVGDLAYVAVGGRSEMFDVLDVTDPLSPTIRGSYIPPDQAAYSFANDMQVVGNLAYITGWYYQYRGSYHYLLEIVDVSDPSAPVQRGRYVMGEELYDLHVAGSLAFIAGEEGMMYIVDVSDPTHPTLRGSARAPQGPASRGEPALRCRREWGQRSCHRARRRA